MPSSPSTHSTTGSSSSASAARSSSGRVGSALVSQPRLLQNQCRSPSPFTIRRSCFASPRQHAPRRSPSNSPILFRLSPPACATAFERASPPAHLTRSSARWPQSAAARSSSQSAQSPSGARSSSSDQSPGLGAAAPVSLASPLPARILFCASPRLTSIRLSAPGDLTRASVPAQQSAAAALAAADASPSPASASPAAPVFKPPQPRPAGVDPVSSAPTTASPVSAACPSLHPHAPVQGRRRLP